MPETLYQVFWIFIIYAFIGWVAEVSFAALKTGSFVNRGFLNGPYCPIYGIGMLVVVKFLYPVKDNWILLFFGSMLMTTVIEYLTGLILEKIFHNKWWDYSDMPFNIQGYVCLMFSVMWGFGCTFVVKIVHPAVHKMILLIPEMVSKVCIILLMLLFLVDILVTVSTIMALNRRLKALDELAGAMKKLSDELGEEIFEKVSTAVSTKEKLQEEYDEKTQQFIKMRDELIGKLKEKHFGTERLLKAFPKMRALQQNETLIKYRQFLSEKKEEMRNIKAFITERK